MRLKRIGKNLIHLFFSSAANEVYPDKDIYNVTYQEDRSVEVMFYNEDQHYQYNVFFDPYSGELLHKQNTGKTFFWFYAHRAYYAVASFAYGNVDC